MFNYSASFSLLIKIFLIFNKLYYWTTRAVLHHDITKKLFLEYLVNLNYVRMITTFKNFNFLNMSLKLVFSNCFYCSNITCHNILSLKNLTKRPSTNFLQNFILALKFFLTFVNKIPEIYFYTWCFMYFNRGLSYL